MRRRSRAPRRLALALLLGALGCRERPEPTNPPDDGPGPSAGPLPTCREAWAGLGAQSRYDFAVDADLGPRGNLGYAGYAERVNRAHCRKAWTVLIYMAADNEDLPLHAYWNLRDIETIAGAATSLEHDVVVHLDLEGPSGLRRLHMMASGDAPPSSAADLQGATPATIRSPIVALDDDEAQPPELLLGRFVTWGMRAYPSDQVAVIIWGHGQGWRPKVASAGPVRYAEREGSFVGGIAFDHHEGSVLDVPSLADALASASRQVRGDAPVDLVIADACLMQSVEVDAALAGVARYVVGYEPIAPYPGLPYGDLLPALAAGVPASERCAPEDRGCAFAGAIPAIYRQAVDAGYYEARGAAESPPVSETFAISTVEGRALTERLLPALSALGRALETWLAEAPIRAIDLLDALSPQGIPGFLGGTRDLGVILTRLEAIVDREATRGPASPATEALREALAGATEALGRAVVGEAHGSGYAARGGLHGLSTWLPRSADELARRLPDYASAPLFRDPAGEASPWRRWIEAVYAAGGS